MRGSSEEPSEEPSRDANATAVGDREQDGVGRRARDLDWPGVARKYLAGFAQDGW